MADAFIDMRELDANTLRDISVQSGVIWPEDGDRESRLFRFRVRRIATEAYRRGAADEAGEAPEKPRLRLPRGPARCSLMFRLR